MNYYRCSSLLTAILLILTLSCFTAEDDSIKALLLTGGGWHDFETQEQLLIEGMDERLGDIIE